MLHFRSWTARWIVSTFIRIANASSKPVVMINFCWEILYTYFYQINLVLWILVITKPEFPHDFAQVQNGQHCLHLSADFLASEKHAIFWGSIRWSWNNSIQKDWWVKLLRQTCCILVSKLVAGFFDVGWHGLKVHFFLLTSTEINPLNIPQ